jgi:hypothetical protein
MEKKITTHITKGLVISLALFILDLIAGFAHFKFATWYKWVPSVILFIAFLWACLSYSAQQDHKVTFGNIFGHGFKTSVVVACLSVIFALLSIFVIFPETRDVALDQARKQMEEKGNISEDNINQALDITKRLFIPFAIAGVIFGTLIIGAIASLIGAAVAKKVPQTPFDTPA